MNKKEFSQYFSYLRKENHLTLKDMSDILFVSPQTINKYEKGLSYPDLAVVFKIAKIFNVDLDSFMNLKNECNNNLCNENEFNIEKFAANFTFLRKINNLTLTDLSKKIGVQYQTISNWEKAKSVPNIEQLIMCSKIFKVSCSSLYFALSESKKTKNKNFWKSKKVFFVCLLVLLCIFTTINILITKLFSDNNVSNNSNLIGNITTSSDINEEKIKYVLPYDVDATIQVYFFEPEDTITIQEQSIIEYKGNYKPSIGCYFTYNNYSFDIMSCCEGIVSEIKKDELYGNIVNIICENTTYAYCGVGNIKVNVGDNVIAGQIIAQADRCEIFSS